MLFRSDMAPVKGMVAIVGEPNEDISSILEVQNQVTGDEPLNQDFNDIVEDKKDMNLVKNKEMKASPIAKKLLERMTLICHW